MIVEFDATIRIREEDADTLETKITVRHYAPRGVEPVAEMIGQQIKSAFEAFRTAIPSESERDGCLF